MDSLGKSSRETLGTAASGEQVKIIEALKDIVAVKLDENGTALSLEMRHLQKITDETMELVAKLSTLTSVTLWPMNDKRLVYLKHLPKVQHADFRNLSHGVSAAGEHITDNGMIPLSELYGLQTLYLSGARISDTGLNHLKGLTNLERLQVDGSFKLAGLKQLSCVSNLVCLEIPGSLGLGYAEFCPNLEEICHFENSTDSGLACLQALTKLKTLRIASDKVTDSGIRLLKTIKSLRELGLFCPNVTEAGIKELQEALPECEIQYDPSPLD